MSTPEYSEFGPVWVAQEYETTDECAPCSHMTWRVADLDDYVIAWDMSESTAKHTALVLNTHEQLWKAATQALAQLERHDAGTANAIRVEFKNALESATAIRRCDDCGGVLFPKSGWIHYNEIQPRGKKAVAVCDMCHSTRAEKEGA